MRVQKKINVYALCCSSGGFATRTIHTKKIFDAQWCARYTRAVIRNSTTFLRPLLWVALVGLLLNLLAAFAWLDNAASRGITFTPAPQPIAHANGPQIGVNAYNLQFEVEQAKVARTLDMARDLGARYVRLHMPWSDVEIHAKNDFEDRRNAERKSAWRKYDVLFAMMAERGLEPIVRIDRPPDWARPRGIAAPEWQAISALNPNADGPPDTFADYADFVGTVATRYATQVRYFQLWNEPNLLDEWGGVAPDPARFLDLFGQASAAARAANPQVVILFPSLAPTDGLDPRGPITDLEFLDAIYDLGGAATFDIMSAQAYGLGQPPDEHRYVAPRRPFSWRRPLDTRIDVSRLPLLREVMEQHGDAGKAIWISEFGYVSAPPELPQGWGPPVSEEQKGQYIVGQIERARREWPYVGVMNVWILRWGGAPPDPADPTAYFALVDQDFNPLPSYTILQNFLAQPAVAGVGAHTPGHAAYTPTTSGAQFRFEGTRLDLIGTGTTGVAIDGGVPVEIALGDTAQPAARGLADDIHTATIGGATPEVLLVVREQPLGWLWEVGAALLLLALAGAGTLAARELGRRR